MHPYAKEFFRRIQTTGHERVSLKDVPEMIPVMWCDALIIFNGTDWVYVDSWVKCQWLLEDIENGLPCMVDKPIDVSPMP